MSSSLINRTKKKIRLGASASSFFVVTTQTKIFDGQQLNFFEYDVDNFLTKIAKSNGRTLKNDSCPAQVLTYNRDESSAFEGGDTMKIFSGMRVDGVSAVLQTAHMLAMVRL